MAGREGWTAVVIFMLGATSAGCARRVNMSAAHGPDQAGVTITYTGVQQEARMFPDYSPLGASILVPEKSEKKGKGP